MKRVGSFSVCALLLFGGLARAQTTFTLGFDGASTVSGNSGDSWNGSYAATLDSSGGGTGAQGWSISVSSDNATISDVTTAGSDVDALFDGGFKKSELTTKGAKDCAGKNGAVSAVVLSFTNPVTLPAPPSASKLAVLAVQGTIGAADGTATLSFVNGCQGAGQPVDNNITQEGATVAPVLGRKDIAIKVVKSCCNDKLNVGFSAAKVSSSTAYDSIVDDGAGLCSAGGGTIVVEVSGPSGAGHAFANISSNNADGGAQGWSLSLAVDGDVTMNGVTTGGTTVDALFDGGFKKTETIDAAKNGGQRGAVSAIVLSFTNPVVLPATGTESVLDFDLAGELDKSGTLSFKNGLKGAGQPVTNAITVGGATANACNFDTASVTVAFRAPAGSPFIRGNANNDGRVNIADAIWIISELFRAGPATACREAADVNNDGQHDLADATYLINHQFAGGTAPPAPYPDCGIEPDADCAESQAACAP